MEKKCLRERGSKDRREKNIEERMEKVEMEPKVKDNKEIEESKIREKRRRDKGEDEKRYCVVRRGTNKQTNKKIIKRAREDFKQKRKKNMAVEKILRVLNGD